MRLPASLLDATRLICVVDLDRVAKTGPFVLDLLARYVSPVDRLRIIASRERSVLVTEVNLAQRIDSIVISRMVDGQRVNVVTSDLVAGELSALTLSEMVVGGQRQWQTPWEDAVVQRATELELGARIPNDIRVIAQNPVTLPVVASTLTALHLRMGIDVGRCSDEDDGATSATSTSNGQT